MWPHFVNLLAASWHSVLVALSTSTLAVILFSIAAPVATFLATMFWVSKANPEKSFMEHLRQSVIPTLIGLAVPLILLVCVFGWKVVETVYGDHQALVAKANTPVPMCPTCPTCPTAKPCKGLSVSVQPVAPKGPEIINSVEAVTPTIKAFPRDLGIDKDGFVITEYTLTSDVAMNPPFTLNLDFDNDIFGIDMLPSPMPSTYLGGGERWNHSHGSLPFGNMGISPNIIWTVHVKSKTRVRLLRPPYIQIGY